MKKLRFALLGAGFWARYQLAGWRETEGVECVAICDPLRPKAEALAAHYNISTVYEDVHTLLANEQVDFLDVCTSPDTHAPLVHLAAEKRLNVVCQKPLANTLADAENMVKACHDAGVSLLVNENWRWQYPLRQFKAQLDAGNIGLPFRARIHYCNSFPVFDNQPFLKTLEQFILTDIGTHILDAARFLFGEAQTLYATTQRIHPDIRGEDVATVMMKMGENITVVCEMSYASRTEIERFPETYVYVEGDQGFLELGPDYWIRETTASGTHARRFVPHHYEWANPAYDLAHSSIVACQTDLLKSLSGNGFSETTGADNLETLRLVFGAYDSAASGEVLHVR